MPDRTDEMNEIYGQMIDRGELTPINEVEPIEQWDHWNYIDPIAPYDGIAEEHRLIVLRDQSAVWEIPEEALEELWRDILPLFDGSHSYLRINFSEGRSVLEFPHVHIIKKHQDEIDADNEFKRAHGLPVMDHQEVLGSCERLVENGLGELATDVYFGWINGDRNEDR